MKRPAGTCLIGLSINGRSSGVGLTYDGINNKQPDGGNDAAPRRSTRSRRCASRRRISRRSTAAAAAPRSRSSPAAGRTTFHGSAAFYKRDDALNGNEFVRRLQCGAGRAARVLAGAVPLRQLRLDRQRSGAPAGQPRSIAQRNRLFFFLSQDILARKDPATVNDAPDADGARTRMATSRRHSPRAKAGSIFIRDPQLAGNCNVSSRRSGVLSRATASRPIASIATAQALLNLFPLPNASDPTGGEPVQLCVPDRCTDWPRDDQVLRVDWNVGPRRPCTAACSSDTRSARGHVAPFGFDGRLSADGDASSKPRRSATSPRCSTRLSPTTFLEGDSRRELGLSAGVAAQPGGARREQPVPRCCQACRSSFPDANPLDLLPKATFNGPAFLVPPHDRIVRDTSAASPSTVTARSGTSRATSPRLEGRTTSRRESSSSTRRGPRSSGRSSTALSASTPIASNPMNTNIGFANALLGAVTSYQESDAQPSGHGLFINTEFYAQDNWRVQPLAHRGGGRALLPAHADANRRVTCRSVRAGRASIRAAAPLLYQPVGHSGDAARGRIR